MSNLKTMEKTLITTKRWINLDEKKISLWKRDTESVIRLLKKRKAELERGQWIPYLEGVGIPRTTAFRLLNGIKNGGAGGQGSTGTGGTGTIPTGTGKATIPTKSGDSSKPKGSNVPNGTFGIGGNGSITIKFDTEKDCLDAIKYAQQIMNQANAKLKELEG